MTAARTLLPVLAVVLAAAFTAGSVRAEQPRLTLRSLPGGGVHVGFEGGIDPARVHALAAWETEPNDANLWMDRRSPPRPTRVPDDLLFRRFVAVDDAGQPLAPAAWFTDLSGLDRHTDPVPWPESIKGVSVPEGGTADLVELGVKHVHVNLTISSMLLPERAPDPPAGFLTELAGETIRFDPEVVAGWDEKIGALTGAGINVVAVLLNPLPVEGGNRDLLHPRTDEAGAPFGLGAFNTTDARGVATYVSALRFLAARYADPAGEHGCVGGWIVGNEVDSHWTWHNLGRASAEEVIEQYATEVRLAWLAIRSRTAAPGVFVSVTHSWARPNSRSPEKNFSGKALLEGLAAASRAGGDFDWAVAYHPYPQNLFQPRYWDDPLAMFGYDTPMITFKNVELLPAWLRRPENLVNGEPRRVILSEQGLHTPDGPDGEEVQAAAYTLSFHRIRETPGIEAYILHRHVDARDEGGLRLGLRRFAPLDGSAPYGEKKLAWHAFRAAGKSGFRESSASALAVAGYDSWADAGPRTGPFPQRSPGWAAFERAEAVHYDLLKRLGEARFEHALRVSQRVVGLPDGGLAESLMLHPKDRGEPAATGTWDVSLPADQPARLVFRTFLPEPGVEGGGDGVAFRVRVGDEVLFEREVRHSAMDDAAVDLSAFAGGTVPLTLEVGPRGDNDYDAAQFLTPAVQLR